jgi:AraC-like DNA-binding protein
MVATLSHLPSEGYRTVPPAAPLRPFVECLWVHVIGRDDPDEDLRILPAGRVDLVWLRGLGPLVAGPQSRFTLRPQRAPLVAIGARFHPGAAPLVLGVPASELLDDHAPLDALDARLAALLDDRLWSAGSQRQAFDALNAYLLRRLDGMARPDPALSAAVSLLGGPRARVADVAASVGFSERQLERRFHGAVGYGPKTLQRILRFQRLLGHLRARPGRVDLAEAAASAGYADQPHLTRESARLSGLSPRELVDWLRPGGALSAASLER